MSLQTISDRKMRRVNRDTGVEFVAIRKSNNYHWVGVTAQHEHYIIDTAAWTVARQRPPCCWTSCRDRFDFEPFHPGLHDA